MGRIAKWISSKIETYIKGTIESRINERIQSLLYASSGDDSPPLSEDRILIIKIDGTGKYIASGVLCESQGAEPGEKKLYSRDNNGNIQAIIYLKGDGTIEINGNSKNAARVDDSTQSTSSEDATYWAWLAGLITVFSVWVPIPGDGGTVLKTALTAFLAANPVPTSLTGKITSGTDKVKLP